jgi:hypothetical protein
MNREAIRSKLQTTCANRDFWALSRAARSVLAELEKAEGDDALVATDLIANLPGDRLLI